MWKSISAFDGQALANGTRRVIGVDMESTFGIERNSSRCNGMGWNGIKMKRTGCGIHVPVLRRLQRKQPKVYTVIYMLYLYLHFYFPA